MRYKIPSNNIKILLIFISLIGFAIIELIDYSFNYPYLNSIKFLFILIYIFNLSTSNNFNAQYITKNKYYRLLLTWTIVAFFLAFKFEYVYIRNQLLLTYLILPFTFPLLARFFTSFQFPLIFRIIHFSNLLYIGFILLYFSSDRINNVPFVEISGKYFAYTNIFMLLFYEVLKNKQKIISLIVYFSSLAFAVFFARRAMIYMLLISGFIALWISFMRKKLIILKILFILFSIFAIYFSFYLYEKYEDSFFSNIKGRLYADSRSRVVADFKKDMTTISLIIGKGIGGTFKAEESGLGDETPSLKRSGIETGYLDYILKGEIIYMGLLLWIY